MSADGSTQTTRVVLEGGRAVAMRRRGFCLRDEAGVEHRFDGATRVRIGTHPDNELVLADETVSRLHARITVEDDGFRVEDLESKNGVQVQGVRVRDAWLADGAELRLGRARLRFAIAPGEVEVPLSRGDSLFGLVGRSAAMRELFDRIGRAAPSDATVLILGETGSGKEGVATAIHEASGRREGPLVVFDCAAVSPQLLESELFGHERGAFTGAVGARDGAVQEAEGGTLFLDEVGELPVELQSKLLRLLERGDYRKVGASKRSTADVRVVAATNRELAREVAEGSFREDLYFRLAVIELRVPPLRTRPEDLRPLVAHLLTELVPDPDGAQRVLDSMTDAVWARLREHRWPGNVRELRNLLQKMVVMGDAPEPPAAEGTAAGETAAEPVVDPSRPWVEQKRELVARLEARYLEAVLARAGHNVSEAARQAGIERMYFKRLCKKHGVL